MLNITLNAQEQNIESGKVEVNKNEVGHEMQSRVKTNVLTDADKCCSCGKWQDTNTHACMPWLIFRNGNNQHFQQSFNIMCMAIISLKDCSKSMIVISFQLYKIKFSMVVQLIHQVYGRNNLDVQRRNGLGNEINHMIL